MSSSHVIIAQVKPEITIDESGKGSATISGTARLSGVNQSSLSKAYANPAHEPHQILAQHGFEPHAFHVTGVPGGCDRLSLWSLLDHTKYFWRQKHDKKLAIR